MLGSSGMSAQRLWPTLTSWLRPRDSCIRKKSPPVVGGRASQCAPKAQRGAQSEKTEARDGASELNSNQVVEAGALICISYQVI
jgi:hypothetical protein